MRFFLLAWEFELSEDDDVGDGDGEHPGEARPADGEEPATAQPAAAHPLQLPNLKRTQFVMSVEIRI